MIGIVVVSHSRRLAEAAVELAVQMVHGTRPPIEIAAGLDGGILGTDAAAVWEAIQRAGTPDGVLVLMDLGSAVLSAELAVELAGDDAPPIVLSEAPIVEGLVAAVVVAAGGATLAEAATEAANTAEIKAKLLSAGIPVSTEISPPPGASVEVALHNAHGLHARPAARLVETVRRFDADVAVRNVTGGGPLVNARSISAVSTIGAVAGHHIEIQASGRQAREALAAVVALVRRNFDDIVATGDPADRPSTAGPMAAAPGIGVGPKCSLAPARPAVPSDRAAGRPEEERARLLAAVQRAGRELQATRERVALATTDHEAAIFDAHLLLLDDADELVGTAVRFIEQSAVFAEAAWRQAVAEVADRFAALPDPYQRARASDVDAVGQQVAAQLNGAAAASFDNVEGVLVAADLSPMEAAALDPERVAAVVTAFGSPVSHGAILARSLGIPMVVGAGGDALAVTDGTTVVVDGSAGVVLFDPPPDTVREYVGRAAEARRRDEALQEAAGRVAVTTDGVRVEVAANIASADDVGAAIRHGADSVGLLRTEFLFLDRRDPPGEDEQFASYLSIADALDGRRLTIRTLDVGGDKHLPYLAGGAEANPFLGRRGIRVSLEQPDLFTQQLRAIVRVGLDHPVSVLFPMVSTIDELRVARRLLEEAATALGCPPGELPPSFEVGVMVEVPALALHARAAAALVDLFSIGTNDLTQYTLAAERGNAAVARLADPLDPAVLRLIAAITDAAGASTRVAVCGELAADPDAAAVLIGLGVDELSMAAPMIPAVKHAIRSLSHDDAQDLGRRALEQESATAVRALTA
jgi:phosphoenolpyruvate-protein phosphotransferase/dihydroxyacetone kinase phosphotransfer subunit